MATNDPESGEYRFKDAPFTNGKSNVNFAEVAEEIRRRAEETNNVSVRIALFGQPGAGKSSLINALVGDEIARVSERTDETKDIEEYLYQGLVLCDLPGYGTARFPAETYFEKFSIIQFDLILCVSAGKFSSADAEFFRRVCVLGKSCIFVRNKSDSLFQRGVTKEQLMGTIVADLEGQIGRPVEVIFTSCVTGEGLDELQREMASLLPRIKRDRFFRDAKAYSTEFLDKKRQACKTYATIIAGAAASVNLVPVPGVGFAADISAIVSLFIYVRSAFGLDDAAIFRIEHIYPQLAPIAKEVIQYFSKEGVVALLKKFSGRIVAAEAAKYTPFVGPMVAGTISFLTLKLIADWCIDDCYRLAEARLNQELKA